MRRKVLAAALLTLVAVSCKAEINAGVDLQADGSVNLTTEFGFDDEFQDFAFQGVDPQEAIFEDNRLADREDAQFDTYTEGEFTFYRIQTSFADADELIAAAGDEFPVANIQVSVTDDEARVSGSTEPGAGDLLGGEDLEGFSPELLSDTIALHFRLTMPGKVTSHNADRVLDDGTLEWDIPLSGQVLDVQAISDPKAGEGGGFPLWLAGAGLAVLVVAGGGAMLLARRRRGSAEPQPAPVAAAVGAAAAAGMPAAPPIEPSPPPPAVEEVAPPPEPPAAVDTGGDEPEDEEVPPLT